jgi:uncharacterized protein
LVKERTEVAKKTAKRVKHVPQRTCVGCRKTLAKRSLIRVVRTPEGVWVDPTGKLAGRGAYLHDRQSCWERGLKGALAHALKVEFTDQDRERLRTFMATLPTDLGEDDSPETAPAETLSLVNQENKLPERDETHG